MFLYTYLQWSEGSSMTFFNPYGQERLLALRQEELARKARRREMLQQKPHVQHRSIWKTVLLQSGSVEEILACAPEATPSSRPNGRPITPEV